MIVEGLSKTGRMCPLSPPCSSHNAETKQSGWRDGWGNENIEAIQDAASSALRRVAAMAADTISRRSQGCCPSGISREVECPSASQEKFGSTACGQSGPGWASTWQNHPECSAHPYLDHWGHAPAAHEPASSDSSNPKNMAGPSSSWEGVGSYTQVMRKWSGHHEHQQCGANRDSQTMLLLESEAELSLRWAGLQPPAAAFAAGTVQAGLPGSEGHRGWFREHSKTSLQDVNCESDGSKGNWGAAKGQQAHAKAVGRPAEYDASGLSSGWDYAGCGGCGDGRRSVESESAHYTWAERQDSSWGCGSEGGLAGGAQSRSHAQWGTVGHSVEGSAAGVNMSMPWVEGSLRSGAGNANADASGWRQGSDSWNWGGSPCNVSGVSDAGRTSSRSCPNVGIHGEGIQVGHGGYDSNGGWLPALADDQVVEGCTAEAWHGQGLAWRNAK